MKETKLKLRPCYCGGEMRIEKVSKDGGMDGMFWNWELTCSECGLTKTYAADGFYGRKYKTFEEVVDDWNKKKEKIIKDDVLDKIRAEIEQNAYPIVSEMNKIEQGMTLYEILRIIDKYKAESEEEK